MAEPPVTTRVAPLPPIDIPVGGSGGGGSGGGGGGEGKKKEDVIKFDSQDARELKNCLMNKLEALSKKKEEKLKKPSEVIKEKDLGCFVKMGLDDLQFGKTSYSWLTDTNEKRGHLGVTDHSLQNVTLYTTRISRRVDQFRHKSEKTLRHVTSQISLDELVHTIQGRPKPYEMYAQQVQANVFAYVWYKQLHNDSTPPFRLYDLDTINKHRDKDCNLTGKFLTEKQKYQNLEKQYADKNKTAKEKAEIQTKMQVIADWFERDMTHELRLHGLLYDENADLGCTEKDKKD